MHEINITHHTVKAINIRGITLTGISKLKSVPSRLRSSGAGMAVIPLINVSDGAEE